MPKPDLTRRSFLRRAAAPVGGLVAARALAGAELATFAAFATTNASQSSKAAGRGSGAPEPPSIVTRAEWGADESRRRTRHRFWPVHQIVVHHTALPPSGDWAADVREVYRLHLERDEGRWGDVGYHFLIDPAGAVYEGRWAREYGPGEAHDGHDPAGRAIQGVHAEGHNVGTVTTDPPSARVARPTTCCPTCASGSPTGSM